MSESLTEELRRIRGIKDVTLREVEKETGISNAYLSQLERGNASSPSPSILFKLAEFYKVPYESLMKAAGYLGKAEKKESNNKKPTAVQAALMSAELTDEENNMVAQYIEFLRSQRRKTIDK